jgi:hypothetical protein
MTGFLRKIRKYEFYALFLKIHPHWFLVAAG